MYRLWNNTDLKEKPIFTEDQREAERIWKRIRSRQDAGNKYVATFEKRCPKCSGWQDMTVDYVTCDCPQ